MTPQRPVIDVVAGVLFNPDGEFLLSSRPAGKPYAGYWEFAGGKIEAGETRLMALQREFHEELGIRIIRATPWLTKTHIYEHACVRLYFYRIAAADWQGKPQAREQQNWCWQCPEHLSVSPMLPANGPILTALTIPGFLSGSLKNGFCGQNGHRHYRIVPWQRAEPAHTRIAFAADEMEQRPSFGQNITVFACVNRPQQWRTIHDADAVIWQLECAADIPDLLAIAQQGSSLPLLAQAPATLLAEHGAALLAAGIHSLIEDHTVALV